MNSKIYSPLSYILRHKFKSAVIILTGFIDSCLTFLLPVSVVEFFSLFFMTGSSNVPPFEKLGIHLNSINQFFMFFLSLLILRSVIGYFENLMTLRLTERYVKELRESIFRIQMRWKPEELSNGGYTKYLLSYGSDLKTVQNYFSSGIMGGIRDLLFLAAGILILAEIQIRLTWIILLLLIASTAATYLIAILQIPFVTHSRSRLSSLLTFVVQSFSEFLGIKNKQSEPIAIKRFIARSENLYLADMRSNSIESLIQVSSFFLVFVMIGVLLWQMTMPYIRISALSGLTIVLIIMMMQGSLRRILSVPDYIRRGRKSLRKINAMAKKEEIPDNENEIIQGIDGGEAVILI